MAHNSSFERRNETNLLVAQGLSAAYGKRQVLSDINFEVAPGEIVTILGHNGAGKTTLLRSIVGQVRPTAGSVTFDGEVLRSDVASRIAAGISVTPAEAPVFKELSLRSNLELGAFTCRDELEKARRLERVHALFPLLKERGDDAAASLSGGQARVLSIGIALMSGPRLMLLDEPSLGISPNLVRDVFETLSALSRDEGLSIVLVEQNVKKALDISDHAYFLRNGTIVHQESAKAARSRSSWWEFY